MAFYEIEKNGVVCHGSTVFGGCDIRHGFTTRLGGVSQGAYESLNLRASGADPDAKANVHENYRRVCGLLGMDTNRLALSKQVHQDTVRHVTESDAGAGFLYPSDYTADALVTDVPGLTLVVFSADCIIILLHDPVTRSIGAVHAGWRGTALGLPAKAVGEMGRLFGARPEDIRAAIGPGIGPCCFETHNDVPDAMRGAFGPGADKYIFPKGEKWTVDLKGINAWRLREAGLDAGKIDVSPLCTACRVDQFWSYRKLGDRRGAQGALIMLSPEDSR